jgi:hypothetical protein
LCPIQKKGKIDTRTAERKAWSLVRTVVGCQRVLAHYSGPFGFLFSVQFFVDLNIAESSVACPHVDKNMVFFYFVDKFGMIGTADAYVKKGYRCGNICSLVQ